MSNTSHHSDASGSDTAHHGEGLPPAVTGLPALFSPTEIEQFEADDVQAGAAIGKMLSLLFLYTICAMGLASWWTFSSVRAHEDEAAMKSAAEETIHGVHGHPHSTEPAH